MTRTRFPAASSASTKWLPMNPAPPVTRLVCIKRVHHKNTTNTSGRIVRSPWSVANHRLRCLLPATDYLLFFQSEQFAKRFPQSMAAPFVGLVGQGGNRSVQELVLQLAKRPFKKRAVL